MFSQLLNSKHCTTQDVEYNHDKEDILIKKKKNHDKEDMQVSNLVLLGAGYEYVSRNQISLNP